MKIPNTAEGFDLGDAIKQVVGLDTSIHPFGFRSGRTMGRLNHLIGFFYPDIDQKEVGSIVFHSAQTDRYGNRPQIRIS